MLCSENTNPDSCAIICLVWGVKMIVIRAELWEICHRFSTGGCILTIIRWIQHGDGQKWYGWKEREKLNVTASRTSVGVFDIERCFRGMGQGCSPSRRKNHNYSCNMIISLISLNRIRGLRGFQQRWCLSWKAKSTIFWLEEGVGQLSNWEQLRYVP